jgi:choline dehydrogenase-like flavoprotein
MASPHPASWTDELTSGEVWLRRALVVAAIFLAFETLVYLLPSLIDIDGSESGWGELPFVANSWVKAGLFGAVCAVIASDLRRFEPMVSVLVAGFVLWVVAGIAILIFGDTSERVEILGVELSMNTIMWIGLAWQAVMAILFAYLHRRAFRQRYDASYLSMGQLRTVTALAESLLGPDVSMAPEEVASRVDHYLAAFRAQRKWVMKAALIGIHFYPLVHLRPPLPLMAADSRRDFLETRFGSDVAQRRVSSLYRWLVQGMIRLAQQIVYLGYYSHPSTHHEVGYVPFSRRERYDPSLRKKPGGLEVMTPRDVRGGEIHADVAIVGSGAAGGIVAHDLVSKGQDVLVLERGGYVDPADFTEDEIDMFSKLYRDGALQLSRDFRLQVLQGMCVGGTTVVNNAVSIPPPDDVLADWNRRLQGALPGSVVDDAVSEVKRLLDIHEQPDLEGVFARGTERFVEGVEALGLSGSARRWGPIEANIRECLGCGYCNIGCAFGRKLSMIDTLLPAAQAEGPGQLRILAECPAERIESQNGRVEAIGCKANGRGLRVTADRFVIAAGAVGSSYLLGRSGVGGPRVGRGLGFNIGSPITADFADRQDTYAGLQITHVFEPERGGPDVVMETWFNPVLSQAIAMPGWFEDHRRNMRRYPHLAATGVIVGSQPNARVRKALLGGSEIQYEPHPDDLARVVDGVKLAGRIYFAAGAERVMPSTFMYHEFRSEEELDRLDEIVRDNSDIQLGTGHPQGGNSLGLSPDQGVVDPRTFRVHGTQNLYLCDASVFPTTLGVNPQLTVMALAKIAAEKIGSGR